MNMVHLVNKPYVNEVILKGKTHPKMLQASWAFDTVLRGLEVKSIGSKEWPLVIGDPAILLRSVISAQKLNFISANFVAIWRLLLLPVYSNPSQSRVSKLAIFVI